MATHSRELHDGRVGLQRLNAPMLVLLMLVVWFAGGVQDFLSVWNARNYRNYFYVAEPKWPILLFTVATAFLVLQRPAILNHISRALVYWIGLMIFLSIVWYIAFPHTFASVDEFKARRIGIAVLCLGAVLLAYPGAGTFIRKAMVPIGIAQVGFNVWDFMVPFSRIPGRAAGLYMNPNTSGYMLCMAMLLSITMIPLAWRKPAIFLFGIGIFLTFSRSAILMYGIAAAVLLGSRTVGDTKPLPLVVIALGVLAGSVLLASAAESVASSFLNELSRDAYSRLVFFASFSLEDHSANSRLLVAGRTFSEILEHPVVGHGLGRPFVLGGLATHNQYLSLLWQHGLFGLMALICFFGSLLMRTDGQEGIIRNLYILLVAVQFWFDHNALTAPNTLLMYAIIVASNEMRSHRVSTEDTHLHPTIRRV